MKIAFRADASISIGSGHVMRCLTLAEALKERGIRVRFVCRELEGNLCELIEARGFEVLRLGPDSVSWEKDANDTATTLADWEKLDWLIVDHYALDGRWESKLREAAKKIMVIDDLADRAHDCDILLDQNYYSDMEARYDGLVPAHCLKLLGPKYALLRTEFRKARESLKKRDGTIKRLLIFFGGSDPTNETAKAIEAVKLLGRPEIAIDVVVGNSNPNRGEIKRLCESMPNTTFHCQVDNMAGLMTEADLSIGAGGSATWERCCLGLPAIVLSLAANQVKIAKGAAAAGVASYLGDGRKTSSEWLCREIRRCLDNPDQLLIMSEKARKIVDSNGGERLCQAIGGYT